MFMVNGCHFVIHLRFVHSKEIRLKTVNSVLLKMTVLISKVIHVILNNDILNEIVNIRILALDSASIE